MVKRKSKAKSRKGKKQSSAILQKIKRMVVFACMVVASLIVVLYGYNYFFPLNQRQSVSSEKTIPQKKRPIADKQRQPAAKPSSSGGKQPAASAKQPAFKFAPKAEIPTLKIKRTEQVITHEGYTVSYNSDYKIANWVAYELTPEEATSKKSERSNKFVPDPLAKGATAMNEDYSRTGFDRGHMAPAGDMKWSVKAMRESFYFSNICPQNPGLNRGIWKELEEQVRLWAKDGNKLLVVTGPVMTDRLKVLGKNRVGIPQQFYKVICYVGGGKPQGVAFLFENRDYDKKPLKGMAIPIDSVEKVTGIDFFPSLPDAMEQAMEEAVNWDSWSF